MHEWREHTAEVELVIAAATEEQVFEEALDAFAELVALDGDGDLATTCCLEVRLDESDRARLLVAWLEELIYLADTRSFVPARAEISLRADGLDARLEGREAALDPIVKAATLHRLEFRHDGEWHARVVLDV